MSLEQARTWLKNSSRIAVLTGAGISAESGVPTFRGAAGLWNSFRPEDLGTPSAFARDPHLVWRWYDWRRGLIAAAEPNPGHRALVELAAARRPAASLSDRLPSLCDGPLDTRKLPQFTLITQNVDGLHHRAGSEDVLEVHGSIWKLRCTRCAHVWTDRTVPLPIPPRCECGSLARPGVVWFGENLPPEVWAAAERATEACDVFLVIGTSAVVYPAAGLVPLARSAGARIIEINIEETAMSGVVDCRLTGPAGDILRKLLELSSRA